MENFENGQRYQSEMNSKPEPECKPETERQLTYGEELVGLTFNPSGDDKVQKAKKLCSELADLINQDGWERKQTSALYDTLFEHTIGEILNAQMNVVKLLTFKY